MSGIPTVEELVSSKYNVNNFNEVALYGSGLKEMMIEFAKLHVQAALKAASEKANISYEKDHQHPSHWFESINKDSILNAYLLENIK